MVEDADDPPDEAAEDSLGPAESDADPDALDPDDVDAVQERWAPEEPTDVDVDTVEDPFDRLPETPVDVTEDLLADAPTPERDVWSAIEPREKQVVETDDDRDVREVPIESYCRDCPHVADPPEFACTYEGSEILAVPSMGVVRLADCPIVAERDRLEAEW